jgi:hypothetical protein
MSNRLENENQKMLGEKEIEINQSGSHFDSIN